MSVEDTLAERGKRYGDFTDHAAVCQRIKLAMIAGAAKWACLPDTHKQALEVIADKIARILTGDPNYADNWHDIQGYAKLVEDRLPRAEIHTMTNPPGEDIYAEFVARYGSPTTFRERVNAVDKSVQRAVEVCLARGAGLPAEIGETCPECGYPTDAAGTHYATCSQLTAPEEYKAEAQVAFDEAAEISEALARQVSAGTLEAAAKNPSIIDDYEEWHCLVCGAVHTRIGHTHQRIGFNPCNPWCPEPVRPEEPAAAMDDDSPRMQAIGQNGNNGEHYDDPFAGAPEWAKYKAQDADGRWFWYEHAPNQLEKHWAFGFGSCGRLEEVDDTANPNWRDTLITRT